MSQPAWSVSWFASRLRDESRRLDLLKAGDLEVRASFALSYNSLDEAEQHAFRLLGLLDADFAAWNLAALSGTDTDDAEQVLERLADAVLVDIAGVDATGLIRYRLHDLLRDFARECLGAAEPDDARRDAVAGLADEYIGDRPAEARALRELGMLLRDQGEQTGSEEALNASQAIFGELGDALWTARVLAGKALLAALRSADPAPPMRQAADICRQCGIAEERIAGALREW